MSRITEITVFSFLLHSAVLNFTQTENFNTHFLYCSDFSFQYL